VCIRSYFRERECVFDAKVGSSCTAGAAGERVLFELFDPPLPLTSKVMLQMPLPTNTSRIAYNAMVTVSASDSAEEDVISDPPTSILVLALLADMQNTTAGDDIYNDTIISIHNGSIPLVSDNQYAAHARIKTRILLVPKVANGNDTKPRTRLTFWNVVKA
jgi:hypothetical protein